MNCFQLIVKDYHNEVIKIYKNQLEKGSSAVVSYEMPCIRKDKKFANKKLESRLSSFLSFQVESRILVSVSYFENTSSIFKDRFGANDFVGDDFIIR